MFSGSIWRGLCSREFGPGIVLGTAAVAEPSRGFERSHWIAERGRRVTKRDARYPPLLDCRCQREATRDTPNGRSKADKTHLSVNEKRQYCPAWAPLEHFHADRT